MRHPTLFMYHASFYPHFHGEGTPMNILLSPAVLLLKRAWGWILRFSENLRFLRFFVKKYFGRKPLRDERYGDGSATAETGRSGRFFLVLISILTEGM